MNSNEGDSASTSRDFSREEAPGYIRDQIIDIENLMKNFDGMGTLDLMLDGKVPEICRSFLISNNSFSPSDRQVAIMDLEKYLDFFKTLDFAIRKLAFAVQTPESTGCHPLCIVHSIRDLCNGRKEYALDGLKKTDSWIIYRKHCEFIEKYSRLESTVETVVYISLEKMLRKQMKWLDILRQKLFEIQSCLEGFQNLEEAMKRQIAVNEEQRQRQKQLVSLIAKFREDHRNLQSQYSSVCDSLENMKALLSMHNLKEE